MSGPWSPAPREAYKGLASDMHTFGYARSTAAGNMDSTAAVDTWRVLR